MLIPVVDRPCLALVRQCRKKKILFSSSLAAPPAGIQSDPDPKRSSACRFSAGCCHRTVQSDLLYPSLLKKTRAPSGRPPLAFSWSALDSLPAGFLFFFSSLMLLFYTNDLLTFEIDKLTWCLKRVWSPSSAPPSLFFWRASGLLFEGTTLSSPLFLPPCAAPFSQVHLGRILHALEIIFALSTHWVPLTVSLASHLLDNFSTVVWLGLATCWRRTSERNHAFVFCFTRFHQVLGWSSCLALSNQQACVRPCCFTGRPRPLGTGFFNGSMVLSFDLLLPPLRFLPYGFLATGSPRLTAFEAPLSPAKLPVSYLFFPILALHRFWPYRLLPLTASV